MPTSNVYLDDDNNVVARDVATSLVETETDDQGRTVAERWFRIVRPGSPEEELIEIVRESERIAAAKSTDRPAPRRNTRRWIIVAIVALVAVVLWLLVR